MKQVGPVAYLEPLPGLPAVGGTVPPAWDEERHAERQQQF